jgi:hypothetical protein
MKKMFLVAIALSGTVVLCFSELQRVEDPARPFREYIRKIRVEEEIRAERSETARQLNDILNQPYLLDRDLKARRAVLQLKLVQNSRAMKDHLESKVETLRAVRLEAPYDELIPALVAVNETRIAAYTRMTKIESHFYEGAKTEVACHRLLPEFEQATADLHSANQKMISLRSKLALAIAHQRAGLSITSAELQGAIAYLDVPEF